MRRGHFVPQLESLAGQPGVGRSKQQRRDGGGREDVRASEGASSASYAGDAQERPWHLFLTTAGNPGRSPRAVLPKL